MTECYRCGQEGHTRSQCPGDVPLPPAAPATMRVQHFLHQPQPRPVYRPEPVVVPRFVNGRPLKGWERVLYREWAVRVRRAELALFDGLLS